MSIPYHAWTHTAGGTDPLPDRPWCKAYYDVGQTIAAATSVELRLDFFQTNRPDVFELDSSSTADPSGILIKAEGIYQLFGFVDGFTDVTRFYHQTQPTSSYPLFGDEDYPTEVTNAMPWAFEVLQRTSHVAKSVIRGVYPDPGDSWRSILAVNPGSAETVSISTLSIVQLGGL